MFEAASACTKRMFSSPGIPKTTETPSFSRHLTISCAGLLIRHLLLATVVAGWVPDVFPNYSKDVSVPIATINPATGETVKTFTPATDQEVDAAIARAHERFLDYRHSPPFAQRAEWANATADLLEKEADDVAAMMTLEMGKTLKSAKAAAIKCAEGFRYYAENAERPRADEVADASKVGAKKAY